jgi:hypothetical protein
MSYKYSSGPQIIGDLKAKDDAQRDTVIDFGEDRIDFQTSGSTRMSVTNDGVQVTGLMIGDEYSLPSTDGTNGQVLQTDGAGNLTFVSVDDGGGGGGEVNETFEEQKFIDANYSTGDQADRSFTFKKHFNFSGISANTWHNVVAFRPYKSGTTTDPEANTLWTAVGMKIEINGHTNGAGNGYRSRTAYVNYNGSSADSGGSSDITLGSCIGTRLNLSGWVTTIQINPNQANATGFSGTVYVEIHFARGAGSNGQNITWNIT